MTDIFEEVNESLRQDTFATWWKKYRVFVFVVIALAIGGVAIWEVLKFQRASDIDRQAKVYDTAPRLWRTATWLRPRPPSHSSRRKRAALARSPT